MYGIFIIKHETHVDIIYHTFSIWVCLVVFTLETRSLNVGWFSRDLFANFSHRMCNSYCTGFDMFELLKSGEKTSWGWQFIPFFTTGFIHPLGFLNHQQYVYHPLVRVSKEPQPFSLQRWFETLMFRVKWWTHPSKVKWHTWRRCITFNCCWDILGSGVVVRPNSLSYIGFSGRGSMVCCV